MEVVLRLLQNLLFHISAVTDVVWNQLIFSSSLMPFGINGLEKINVVTETSYLKICNVDRETSSGKGKKDQAKAMLKYGSKWMNIMRETWKEEVVVPTFNPSDFRNIKDSDAMISAERTGA